MADPNTAFISLMLLLSFSLLLLLYIIIRPRPTRIPIKSRHVFVTGGSSGIGLSLAHHFASQGSRVSILARDQSKLESAKQEIRLATGVDVTTFSADVRDYDSVKKAVESAGPIDILVCNQGVFTPQELENQKLEEIKFMVDVNLMGCFHLIKAALPFMKLDRQTRGPRSIAIMSSQAGQVGIYGYTAYSASKFGLRGLAEALQQEVIADDIHVSLIFPPDTETPGLEEEHKRRPELTTVIYVARGRKRKRLRVRKRGRGNGKVPKIKKRAYWDWSWEELALYDLTAMVKYIYQTADSKIFLVGHSQGTIMSLAAFTQPDIVEMVQAAALLCPISYLEHVTAPFVLRMVHMYLDKMVLAMGIHQLNFRSNIGVQILDSVCDGHLDCNNLLASITGNNCCFNTSRVDFYLDYEPHPSSTKNLNHLFQMIRKGTFAKYDYGFFRNLRIYGSTQPPIFDLSLVPESLPLWMAYGGSDDLADVTDVQHTLKELPCKKELLYLDDYGHVDFLLSVNAKEDIYEHMINFFSSWGKSSSFK